MWNDRELPVESMVLVVLSRHGHGQLNPTVEVLLLAKLLEVR